MNKAKKDGVISVTDENGKVYEFEKPDFECELLKIDKKNNIIGLIEGIIAMWDIPNGDCSYTEFQSGEYNLTPIKPKWYKYKRNFHAY